MKLHILTKIRITIVILISIAITWFLNSRYMFNDSEMPINIVFSGNYTSIALFTLASAAACAIAFFLGGRNTRYIAPLAAPFSLIIPVLFTENMNKLLVQFQGNDRAGMFKMLFFDTLLWYIPVIAGLAVVVLLTKSYSKKNPPAVSENKLQFDKSPGKCLGAAILASVIAIIILPFLCQGDPTRMTAGGSTILLNTPVSIGQQAFAVTAGLFLAVMASHQIMRTSGRAYIIVPVIVAGYFYLTGGNSIWESLNNIGASPLLIPPKAATKTVLPIVFASFGSLGVAWGYWNSYKIHFARENNLIKVK